MGSINFVSSHCGFSALFIVLFLLATIGLTAHIRTRSRQPDRTRDLYIEKEALLEEARGPPSSDQKLQALIPANEHRVGRGDWVQIMHSHVHDTRHGKKYNTLIFNTAVERQFFPEGVIEQFTVNYDNCKENSTIEYEVTVFRKGSLISLGDGGYINWCFDGNFERLGKTVEFFEVERA